MRGTLQWTAVFFRPLVCKDDRWAEEPKRGNMLIMHHKQAVDHNNISTLKCMCSGGNFNTSFSQCISAERGEQDEKRSCFPHLVCIIPIISKLAKKMFWPDDCSAAGSLAWTEFSSLAQVLLFTHIYLSLPLRRNRVMTLEKDPPKKWMLLRKILRAFFFSSPFAAWF